MRVLILGAGFGGLELATCLSQALGDRVAVTLIDKSDSFVFGFAKLDVMFGKADPATVRLPYRAIAKPGSRSSPATGPGPTPKGHGTGLPPPFRSPTAGTWSTTWVITRSSRKVGSSVRSVFASFLRRT